MLYVDGMNGVMRNPGAVSFLYKLIAAPNALVCKTAIKLLLVFVEYTDSNCLASLFFRETSQISCQGGIGGKIQIQSLPPRPSGARELRSG